MAVFPDTMQTLSGLKPEEKIKVMEDYIRYMTERTEFSFSSMNKKITELQAEVNRLLANGGNGNGNNG